MSEPRRLLSDPDATPFERGLLESWSTEQPSDAARGQALAIAGGALAAAATAAGVGSIAPKAAVVASATLLKWPLVGAVLIAGGAATIVLATRSPQASVTGVPTASALATARARATTAIPTTTAIAPSVEPPTLSPGDLPTAPDVRAPITTGSSLAHAGAAAAPSQRDASLAEEITLFDRARAALEAGDASRALALLDDYESRFRTGVFVQEAEVLRVQALLRNGDRAAARRVGERFLAAYPRSPHAARLRAILDPSSP